MEICEVAMRRTGSSNQLHCHETGFPFITHSTSVIAKWSDPLGSNGEAKLWSGFQCGP